ncbi:MAG: DUF6491 family protein [Litorimonas sp.]
MQRSLLISVVICIPFAGTVSCASFDDDRSPRGAAQFADDARLGEEVNNVCFSGSIDGFGETTRNTVVLTRGVSDRYLVEVLGGCQNLEFALGIGVDSRSSCLSRGDKLILSDSPFVNNDRTGLGLQRCTISKIFKWNKDADETAPDDVDNVEGSSSES